MRWSISPIAAVILLAGACKNPYTQGHQLYRVYCANCHMEDGTGLGFNIPPLAGSDYLKISRSEVPCLIRYGSRGGREMNGTTFLEPMPSFSNLNEVEISNLMNYINTAWENRFPETSPAEVARYLQACAPQEQRQSGD